VRGALVAIDLPAAPAEHPCEFIVALDRNA